jgi:hypothetical protein
MSGPSNAPAPLSEASKALSIADIVDDRRSFAEIATAVGCTERSVYNLVARHQIPFIRLLSKRYARPADIREALLRDETNRSPRARGRPKAAA